MSNFNWLRRKWIRLESNAIIDLAKSKVNTADNHENEHYVCSYVRRVRYQLS